MLSANQISHSSLQWKTHFGIVAYHYFFAVWMCPLDSLVSPGVEADSVAFGQFWNILFIFSGVMLNIRSFFTSMY